MPPVLTNDRDTPDAISRRSAQDDPWVMYLVVRQDVPVSGPEVLVAAAQATIRCAEEYASSAAWAEAFRVWSERSFRKVSLRARSSVWARLAAYDGGAARVGTTELVRALPPRRRSERDPFLRNLQVYNPDAASISRTAVAAGEPGADASAMTFVVSPTAAMSLGKQVAQVAHAVLMCAWSPLAQEPRYRDAFEAWRRQRHPCRVVASEAWARARAAADCVVVRDAGLTEVTPGTETVLALPPGSVL